MVHDIDYSSQALRSRLPELLGRLPTGLVASLTGLPREQIRELVTDERRIPSAPVLERLALRTGIRPGRAVVLEPHGRMPEVIPEWFDGGRRRARIVICGMGNLGHVQATLLAARPELEVRCLVSSRERAQTLNAAMQEHGGIRVTLGDGRSIQALPERITEDPAAVVPDADFVFLATPCHLHLDQMRRLVPLMREGATLAAGPAWGGFNWKARRVLEETGAQVRVIGLAGIPTMSKIEVPGRAARVIGVPKSLNAQQPLDAADRGHATDVLSMLFDQPVLDIHNYLNINLAPGNQLLHTGIMYDLLQRRGDRPFAEPPLFYESLSRSGARLLKAMSRELLDVATTLADAHQDYWTFRYATLHLGIRMGYAGQIRNPWTLHGAIRTNAAYQGLPTPMVQEADGYRPDFSHRFFAEDVPHGLVIARGVAQIAGVATPEMDRVLDWCQQLMGREYLVDGRMAGRDLYESAAPQAFGIDEAQTLIASVLPARS
mgnify:CR=1 FL=1